LVGIYLPVASPNVSFCHEGKANVPKTVQTTILLVLAALFDDRDGSGEGGYLTLEVQSHGFLVATAILQPLKGKERPGRGAV
jgi:hypothetical protein